jgi:hypothetical protein
MITFGPLTSMALNFLKDRGWDTDALASELLARDAQPLLDQLNVETTEKGIDRVHEYQRLVRETLAAYAYYQHHQGGGAGDGGTPPVPGWLTALAGTAETCVRERKPSRYA